ncbi:hypothetical protein ACFB49_20220 [Sphingomonas sp. DBB INV C78]|uniref:PEPxxWA-CTERM sorting domain-containing protein n=1 Tax=Sphingomonas sp. DBB INV C78 TaxID=3349434 RepID=UPI0036D289BF
MRNIGFIVAAASALVAAPASAAVTFNLGGAAQKTQTSYTYTVGGTTLVTSGYSYADSAYSPAAFTALANGSNVATIQPLLTTAIIGRDSFGLGVCPGGTETAGECNQIDTNGLNELLSVKVTPGDHALASAIFSQIDSDDTLNLFGIKSDGQIVRIGFSGKFDGPGSGTGFGGGATGTGSGSTYTVNFNTGGFSEFWFATNNASNDGFRLNSVTVAAVPEPAAWAMMITGFGLVGGAMRQRRTKIVFA